MADRTYGATNVAFRTALRTFASWRVEGRENVPPMGPLIVVANHLSNIDPPLLAVSIPRRLHYLAKRGLFKPGMGTFLKAYGAYPLSREGRDLEAFLWARRLLEQDKAIVLFPEAHRHPGLGMQRAVPGVALLALRAQAPILPVGITGTGHMGPILRVFYPTGNITVRIGQPFTLPLIEGRVPRQQLEALADMVMQRIAMLLPPEYRGVYQHSSASPAQEQGNATPR